MLHQVLENEVKNFRAGQLSLHLQKWHEITSDNEVLSTIEGLKLDFNSTPKTNKIKKNQFSKSETELMDQEVQKLLSKDIITFSSHDKNEIISPVFLRHKQDGTFRMILNLKETNEYIDKIHFKMESIKSVLRLVTPSCYMSSIDLKDAYYSVSIHPDHRKYLKFQFQNKLYEFTCLPNGLTSGPRKFTKITKAPLAKLRRLHHILACYIDDILAVAENEKQCQKTVLETIELFHNLGFIIHPTKSSLKLRQRITFLGFIIDSVQMRITLTGEKRNKIEALCKKLVSQNEHTIRFVCKVIGNLIASFPAVKFGPLHYRNLDMCKNLFLKINKGEFSAKMILNKESIEEINWWINNIATAYNDIFQTLPNLELKTDASEIGWGAVFKNLRTHGHWSADEISLKNINALELNAVLFALKSFDFGKGNHIKCLSDNTTAVQTVNHMGTSHSYKCNELVYNIWCELIRNENFITMAHIPGVFNEEADKESRKQATRTEWKLKRCVFESIMKTFQFLPKIDLFASRLNCQLKPFVSFRPDPEALHVNSFLLPWSCTKFYAFPPFSVISRVVQKIYLEQAEGILVVPNWPNQPWYSKLMNMLNKKPMLIPHRKDLLTLPEKEQRTHPLNLELLACHTFAKL